MVMTVRFGGASGGSCDGRGGEDLCFGQRGGRSSWGGNRAVEIGGKIDEVGDGHHAIVIQITVAVGGRGFVQVGSEGDEIGDGGSAREKFRKSDPTFVRLLVLSLRAQADHQPRVFAGVGDVHLEGA